MLWPVNQQLFVATSECSMRYIRSLFGVCKLLSTALGLLWLPLFNCLMLLLFVCTQVGDFGMARDLEDENYYISHGGRIPVKWTSFEVCNSVHFHECHCNYCDNVSMFVPCRRWHTVNSPRQVMCGALVCSCMRYGVWDTNHLKAIQTNKLAQHNNNNSDFIFFCSYLQK